VRTDRARAKPLLTRHRPTLRLAPRRRAARPRRVGSRAPPLGPRSVGFGLGSPSSSLPRDRLSAKLLQAQAETKLRQSMLTAMADPVSIQQLQLHAQQQQMQLAMWQAQQQRMAMLAMQQQQQAGAPLHELQRQQLAMMMQAQQRQLQPWGGGWDATTPAAGLSSAASLPVLPRGGGGGGRAASNAYAYGSSAQLAQAGFAKGSGNALSTPTLPSIGGLKAGLR
jgi:hypothetical protein